MKFRVALAMLREDQISKSSGEFEFELELDESYFGGI